GARLQADIARGARPVDDDDLLAEHFGQARLQDPADEVRGAARCERNDHRDRLVGIIALCIYKKWNKEKKRYPLFHASSDSIGSGMAFLRFADRSKALVSMRRLCASAAVACWVGRPIDT